MVKCYIALLAIKRSIFLNINNNKELECLKSFLLDIDCLNKLSEWITDFNIFEILKISRMEIRHSNILAWLLDPNENHGLNDSVLRCLFQLIIKNDCIDIDIFQLLLMDLNSFYVKREWNDIDLLIESKEKKIVLCIENKIYSGEHSNQLKKYHNFIEITYPDYTKIYLFLSPYGTDSSEPDIWHSISYTDIKNIIENSCKNIKLLPQAELLINNYINTIRRITLDDEKLVEVCNGIYKKHQKALDLIYENRVDNVMFISNTIKKWFKKKFEEGKIIFDLNDSSKTILKFKTETMSKILPDSENTFSGWNTRNYYFYEIINTGDNKTRINFEVNSINIPDELNEKINILFKENKKKFKENWKWSNIKTIHKFSLNNEFDENEINEELNKGLKKVIEFERKMIKAFDIQ